MILVVSVGDNAWLTDRAEQTATAERQAVQLHVTGTLLADTARRLMVAGDLASIRRLTTETAATLHVGTCRVSIGDGRVLADAATGRVNTTSVPQQWTAAAADALAGVTRIAFDVDGRGPGFVDIAAADASPAASRFALSASICAVALGVLVLIYRRTRGRLAELDVVRGSLAAMDAGESAVDALEVDARLGPTAAAWNQLLGDYDALRTRARSGAISAVQKNRGAGGNLESACDAMSQGIVLIDDKMRVGYASGAACTFLNVDRKMVHGTEAVGLIGDAKFKDPIDGIASGKQRRPCMFELEQPPEAGGGVLRVCVRPVTPTAVVGGVSNFSFDYATRALGTAAATERTIFDHTNVGVTLKDFAVTDQKWAAQQYVPSLPGGTTSYSISRVRVALKAGSQDSVMHVSVRTADVLGRPTSAVLGRATVYVSALSTQYEWVDVPFTGLSGLSPSQSLALVVGYVSGGNAAGSMQYDQALLALLSGANWSTSSDAGSSWSGLTSLSAGRMVVYATVP